MRRDLFTLVTVFIEFNRLGSVDLVFFGYVILLIADFAHQAD